MSDIATKIHFDTRNVLRMKIWLVGEDLNNEPQLEVIFRNINDKYEAIIGFTNMYDGVDAESMGKILTNICLYKDRLNRFVNTSGLNPVE